MSIEFAMPGGYLSYMRRAFIWLALAGWLGAAMCAQAATGRMVKVLPQLLDQKGRNSLSPSLYERDTYQAYLLQHTNLCSGMRFNVLWRTRGQPAAPLKVRLELRGVAHGDFPKQLVLETPVERHGWFNQWTYFTVVGEEYKNIGRVTSWRATLWEGDRLLSEQKSYLW